MSLIFGMAWENFLALSVIGACVTTLGSFIALLLKDFVAVRSFERWKSEQALALIFDRHRRPICFAAKELSGRCYDFAMRTEWDESTTAFKLLTKSSTDVDRNAEENDVYYRYKLLSNAYRLCCFLGWIELYRRDLGLIDAGKLRPSQRMEILIDHIRSDIADGQLNESEDSRQWKDVIIFREEQRAIAHRIIGVDGAAPIDFGTFCEIIESDGSAKSSGRWFILAVYFFADLRLESDYRRIRMKRLNVHLNSLRELLEPGSIAPEHVRGTLKLAEELGLIADTYVV